MSFKPVHGTGCGRMAKLRAEIAAADEGQAAGRPLRAALLSATMLAGAASLALLTPQQALAQQVYDDVDLENDGGDMNFAGDLVIAQSGTTTLTVFNAGTLSNTNGTIGFSAGSNGTVTVTGADSTWTNSQALRIGDLGTGTLTISDGGRVNSASGFAAFRSGSTGAVTVTGAGSLWNNPGEIRIGGLGAGTLTILDGGSVRSGVAYVAHESGSSAVVTVSGAGSEWIGTDFLRIGGAGSANMTISDGGLVQNTRGEIGVGTPVVSSVLVTGTDSRWINTDELRIGVFGTGTLSIADGGAVSAANVTLANNPSATGTLIFGAAEGDAAAAAGTLNTSSIAFGVGAGTIVFNHTDDDFELDSDISGNGTIRLLSGRTILSGNSTYTGNTFLEGGTLTLGHSNALGGSTLTTTGSVVDYVDGVNITNAVVIDSNTTQFQVLAGSATQSGVISEDNGPRPFEKIGDGELILTAANTWTGETTVTNGTLTFDGGSVALAADTILYVGRNNGDAGALRIENGGAVSNTLGVIGNGAGSTGEATVTGAGSTWTNSGNLTVGFSGAGTLTIADGGAVLNAAGRIGSSTGSTGEVTVTGVGSTWTNSGILDVGRSGDGTLMIADGGAVSNSFGNVGTNAGSTGAVTVTGADSTWTNSAQLRIGQSGSGALTIADGGAVSSGAGWIGTNTGSTGQVNITGVDSSWTLASLHVGNSGDGTLIIENGGAATSTFGYIGGFAGATGAATVTGAGSTWTNSSTLSVGDSGSGTLTISDGGAVTNTSGTVGSAASSIGAVSVTGADSLWTNSSTLTVGNNGSGTLTISDGGAVSNTNGIIGLNNVSTGTVTVTGAGSTWANSGELFVGYIGAGTLTIADGGSVTSSQGEIGSEAGSTGEVTVTGAGSSWTNAADLYVGYVGNGTLIVANGGTVSNLRAPIGRANGSTGVAIVTGEGSTWTSTTLEIGRSGTGTLTIADGGAVSASDTHIGRFLNGAGTLNFGAAAGDAAAAAGTLDTPTITFGAGGGSGGTIGGSGGTGGTIVFNHTSDDLELDAAIFGDGTIRLLSGRTILSGNSTYTGNTFLEGGTLTLGHSNALGGSTLTTTGSVVDYVDGVNITNAVVIDSNTTQFQVLSGSATQSGVISELNGQRPFEKIGDGELILTAANTWTGQTTITNGMLTFDGGSVALASGRDIYVGRNNGDDGTLRIENGGAVSNEEGYIGFNTGSTGEVAVTGPGSTWTNSAALTVGDSGGGTLNIEDGGAVSNTEGYIGISSGSTGTVTVTGAGSTWTNNDWLYVGLSGAGTLTIADGGAVSNAAGLIGGNSSSTSAATVTGAGSTWTNTGQLSVGNSGSGTLTISDGGAVSNASGTIGLNASGTGAVTVTGAGSTWTNSSNLTVGSSGSATLTISDGGVVSNNDGYIGRNAGSTGNVTITGAGSTWVSPFLDIGDGGTGSLTIADGGALETLAAWVGTSAGATGMVTVTGTDSIWTNTGTMRVGNNGTGTLTVADGGTVNANGMNLGRFASSTGTLNIGAAAGDAAVAAGTLNTPTLTFGVGTGTIVFNHMGSGAGYSFASDISGGGAGNSLIRQLAGLTRLTGANTGYGGAFAAEGGTLFVDSALGGAGGTVMSGGTLSGAGSIAGLVTVNAGGILAGMSGSTLNMDELVLDDGAVINVALGAPGGSELFAVGGDLTLDGTVNVSDAGGFGQGLYTLFTYGGALTDNGLVLGNLPSGLNPGDQTIQTGVAGQVNLITVFPASIPVEFTFWDGDGAGNASNGRVDGGSGVWSLTRENWTTAAGDVNGAMNPVPGFAIFTGEAGTVTADESAGNLSALGMQFAVDGYELTGDRIELVANAGASLLRVGNGGAAGAGMTATIRNNLYGNTDFVLSDLGRLVLTGSNSWTGETQVRSGTLLLDGGSITHAGSDLRVGTGNGGNAALVIANGGAISNGAGHVGESDGSSGAVTVTGAGSLWTNAASLGVGMSGTGTLTIADGGRVSATGVTLAQNAASTGTLNIGAAAGSGAQAAGTLDSATVQFGEGVGRLVFNHTASGAGYAFGAGLSSQAGGDALIRQLSGFTRLTGNSAGYLGNLEVSGGTLSVDGVLGSGSVTANVSSGGTLTGSGTLGGDVMIGAGAILAGQSGQTFTIGGNLFLAGDALVNVALGAPGGSAELFAVGGDLTLDGTLNLSDAGGFGPGLYTLFSYGGTLTDNGLEIGPAPFPGILPGELAIQTSIAGSVNLVSNINVDLLFWDGSDPANAANGLIDGGDGVWSADSLTFTDIGGLVSRPSGPPPGFLVFAAAAGNVTVDGSAGEIAIEGAQFAVDGYVIDGDAITLAGEEAILRVGNGTAIGAGFTARIGSALAGDAALVKTDFGTLILTGANSYTGGTQVREGTLIGSTASIVGNIANDGVVVFDQAGDATLGQTLSGNGLFRFTGGAQFTLGASNSHAGGTHVSGSGLVLAASDSAGTGAITLQDASLAFAGGIEVSNGLAVSGTNSLQVSSGTASYGGGLTGSGALTLGGPGTLVFAGNGSAFAGQTTITGNVLMNGSLGGTVEVGEGGILRGFGTLGSTRLQAGSTIAPGNSVGTLTINGNLVFEAGSLYEATALPNGQSDLIQVTGGITINGGSVLLVGSDSGFSANTGYTILTAGGGITGQFDSVSSNLSFLTPVLDASGNSLTLNLVRNDVEFAQFATSPNQASAAHAADSLGAGNPLWETLVMLDDASATPAFEALQGEIHATHRQLVMDDTLHARRAVSSRLAAARGDDARSAWISGHFGGAQLGSRDGLTRTSSDSSGVMLGLDARVHQQTRLGIMAGFGETGFDLAGRNAAGTADSRSLGVYGGTQLGALTVSAGAIHGWHDMTTSRAVSFAGVDEQIRSSYSADSVQLFGEAALAGPAGLEPFVSLAHVRLDTGGFSEVGGITTLNIDSDTRQMTQGTLGTRFGHDWQTGGTHVRLEGSLGWRRVFSGERQFVSGDLSGAPVFFEGNGVDRDAAAVEAGITIEPAARMSLSLGYAGEIGSGARNHGAQFRMALTF